MCPILRRVIEVSCFFVTFSVKGHGKVVLFISCSLDVSLIRLFSHWSFMFLAMVLLMSWYENSMAERELFNEWASLAAL